MQYPHSAGKKSLIIYMNDEMWKMALIDVLKTQPDWPGFLSLYEASPIKCNGLFYPLSTQASVFKAYPILEFVTRQGNFLRCISFYGNVSFSSLAPLS